ncbi:MAG: hypothetical protein U9Q75_00945, partial [Pseudomonadota bacterium]|nr:hypothetical protein [Pseudomonadota bacterium]
MALFRCNKCGHIREVGNDYIGKSANCPKCDQITPIYDTTAFVKALILKHITLNNKLQELRKKYVKRNDVVESDSIEEIDIYNTKALTQADRYESILQWFEKRNIQVQVNHEAIDTTGFFDEIALSIGGNFSVLRFVSEHIKYIQNKGYANVKLDVSRKSPEEIKQITVFCKEMYDYSFVAKYYYQKKDKIIRLTLQTAPKIRDFFNGIWMEWFTLMRLLEFFRDQKINASCMRSLNITFPNGVSNELDIFFVTKNNTPVCIECKSGEFRQDIDKYLKLRKQLNIEKNQFVVCVFGLSREQAQGMTSMYD